MAAAEADLRQPRAFAHQHRKGLRADLGVERAVVAGVDAVEAARAVGDDAGEHVDAAGRAFRIGGGGDVVRQRQAFQQRHDVDAVGFQHRAAGQRDLVQLQLGDALGDRGLRPRQEARAHAVGDLAEPQIEARRLDLIGREIARRDESRRSPQAPRSCGRAECPWSPLAAGTIASRCDDFDAARLRSSPTAALTGRQLGSYDHIYLVVI